MAQGQDPLGSLFGDAFGPLGSFQDAFARREAQAKKPEKGVPWHAKVIEGDYYVPLTDVLALLKENDILPGVQAGLERRIKDGPNAR